MLCTDVKWPSGATTTQKKKNPASFLQRFGVTFFAEAFATSYLADNQGPVSNAAVRGCVPGS